MAKHIKTNIEEQIISIENNLSFYKEVISKVGNNVFIDKDNKVIFCKSKDIINTFQVEFIIDNNNYSYSTIYVYRYTIINGIKVYYNASGNGIANIFSSYNDYTINFSQHTKWLFSSNKEILDSLVNLIFKTKCKEKVLLFNTRSNKNHPGKTYILDELNKLSSKHLLLS